MRIYDKTIKFPETTHVRIIGGHPAAGLLLTKGVVLDTLDDSQEPYYECYIIGDPRAVFPYTESRCRTLEQSVLEAVDDETVGRYRDKVFEELFTDRKTTSERILKDIGHFMSRKLDLVRILDTMRNK